MTKGKKIGVSIAAVGLAAVIGVSSLVIAPNFTQEQVLTGLQTISGELYYYDEDGVRLYGWHTIGGNLYYFDSETGRAKTGWFTDEDGAIYYFGIDGVALTGTHTVDGVSYTFGTDGRLMIHTGVEGYTWEVLDGETYCVGPDGQYLTGLKRVEGALYYFNEKGVRQVGWQTIDGKLYYFDESIGKAARGWLTQDGETYYFTQEGYALTGSQTINGKSYTFDAKGRLVRQETFKLDDGVTQMSARGGADTNLAPAGTPAQSAASTAEPEKAPKPAETKKGYDWVQRSGNRYYENAKGKKTTGLKTIDGDIYYFDENGQMQTGWQLVNGRKYCFDELGCAMVGWVTGSDNTYYFCEAGYALTGMQTLESEIFFFDAEGVLKRGVHAVNGKVYSFSGSQSEAVAGWVEVKTPAGGSVSTTSASSEKYFFGKDGIALTGLQLLEGKTYIFDGTSAKMLTGWQELDGKLYYLGTDGVAAGSCWLQHEEGMVYLGADGAALTGLQTIGGQLYAFSDKGFRLSGWVSLAEGRYCFEGENDTVLKNTWMTDREDKVYLGGDGRACTGLVELPIEEDAQTKAFYLFDGNGVLMTGKQWDSEGRLYMPDGNGIVRFGWLEAGEDTYYIGEDGYALTGLQTIDGALYGFDEQGVRQSGVFEWDGRSYGLFGENGEAVKGHYNLGVDTYSFGEDYAARTGICTVGEDLCFFNEKGVAQAGWQTDAEGNHYYFGRDGRALKGWFTDISREETYYFTANGRAVTGEKKVEGVSYTFDSEGRLMDSSLSIEGREGLVGSGGALYGYTSGGEPLTGWYATAEGGKYYFGGEAGAALSGWQTIDGSRYYFDADGVALTGLARITEEDGTFLYCFDDEGVLVEGEKNIAGLTYAFDAGNSGRARTGWDPAIGDSGAKYYGQGGYALTGVQKIDGEVYRFDEDGVQKTGWLEDNRSYGFLGENGAALRGVQEIGGKLHAFDENGVAKAGFHRDATGVCYYGPRGLVQTGWMGDFCFDENGRGLEGVVSLSDGNTYRFSGGYNLGDVEAGSSVYSWVAEGGNNYYMDAAGNRKTGLLAIEGGLYYLKASGADKGARQSGWQTVDGKTYYFSKSTGRALTGWFVKDGKTYYLAQNGTLCKGTHTIDGRDCSFDKTDGHQLVSVAANEDILATDTGTAANVGTAAYKAKGIDVSQWQGQINWSKVAKSGVKFAIVRSLTWSRDVGYYVIDPYFDYNIRMAKANGIKVGTYLYSYAYSKADMKTEINFFMKSKEIKGLLADGIYFDLPVYIDYEDPLVINNTAHLTRAQRTAIVRYGMDLIKSKSGGKYMPGFYTYYYFALNTIDGATLQRQDYEFWLARYDVGSHGWSPDPPIWQYSSTGSVPGISGNVDMNYAYKDYSKYINPGKKVAGALARKITITNQNGKKVTDTALNIISQIVMGEVGAFGQPELYKAQAVAAQTYILYQQSKGVKAPQMTLGAPPTDDVLNAVYSVLNKKMTYNGKTAFTPYHAWNNGKTNSSVDVWGTNLPYLLTVDSSESKAGSNTSGSITVANLKKRIEAVYGSGATRGYAEKDWIKITTTNSAGYVTGVEVCGHKPTVEYFYKTILRHTVSGKVVTPVESPGFTATYKSKTASWSFKSKGWGHCVGMSQYGASALAAQGKSYSSILKTYYKGVSIENIS